ncbi:MAG: hypothetical protein DRJ98_03280 [Thermoprotei archaeon]|nr:MAG: hypothetical protein DRJ98_03280 [Thermoprotei archaeon]RLF18894.1 MAG: hypothetical protein DRN06_00115 [Thermoprotei archaeon]
MSKVEKRLRLRRMEGVVEGEAKVNPRTMEYLGIESLLEVVIAGKRKFTFKALPSESTPANEVWINPNEARMKGIADNSIATVRAKQ